MSEPRLPKDALRYYRDMKRIRDFENRAAELFSQGLIPGNLHTSVGQEAVAVGTWPR